MLEVKVDFLPETGTLQTFKLFQTKEHYYLVGADSLKTKFLLLKILRSPEQALRNIIREKAQPMNAQEIDSYLDTVEDEEGELKEVAEGVGLVGFVKFLFGYYLILITKREVVGLIGLHILYKITDVRYIRLFEAPPDALPSVIKSELKYLQFFRDVDLTKGFFFSYTYDLTKSLQENVISSVVTPMVRSEEASPISQRSLSNDGLTPREGPLLSEIDDDGPDAFQERQRREARDSLCHNEKFMWNYFLVSELHGTLYQKKWVLPLIHGSIDQANLSSFSKCVRVTLVSRRSRHFAGTRYLKRGLNREGSVANYVVTQQIVYDQSTSTSGKPIMSAYLQNRGSIPLFWSQVANPIKPKPDIILHRNDSLYDATKQHIAEMLAEHGEPLYLLNLTKSKESNHRERWISDEFREAVLHINNTLPGRHRLHYRHYDIKKHKANLETFIPTVNGMADEYVEGTGIFLCSSRLRNSELCTLRTQSGIIRTNCIDSLDRTNFMQQLIGVNVLGKQLYAVGLRDTPKLHVGTNPSLCQSLLSLYDKMGDLLAMQYGGSIAHHHQLIKKKNFNLLPKIIVSFKRYWSNAFVDPHKQGAINLFLGLYQPLKQVVPLWDMKDDFDLHHRTQPTSTQRSWWREPLWRFKVRIPKQQWYQELPPQPKRISLEPPTLASPFVTAVSRLTSRQQPRIRALTRLRKSLYTVPEEEAMLAESVENKQLQMQRTHSETFSKAEEELAQVRAQERQEEQRLTSLSDSLIEGVDLERFGENDPFFEFDNCEKVKLFDELLKSAQHRWKNITFNQDFEHDFDDSEYDYICELPPPEPEVSREDTCFVEPEVIVTEQEKGEYEQYVRSSELLGTASQREGFWEIGRESASSVKEIYDLSDFTELKHPTNLRQEIAEDAHYFEKYMQFSLETLRGSQAGREVKEKENEREEEEQEAAAVIASQGQSEGARKVQELMSEPGVLNSMCYGPISKRSRQPAHRWYLQLFRKADELGRVKSLTADGQRRNGHTKERRSVVASRGKKQKLLIQGYFG